ncbi:MAG: saccharopine dehydrogenase NADP-binding domain-containing protein [Gammaproteobacteria bacterium]
MMHTVLVLGGYGFFGARIAAELARTGASRVLIGGRDLDKARHTAKALGLRARSAVQLDADGPNLAETLGARRVNLVIHTAGPFQGQGYGVAAAAILAGANYIDLADGRAFVGGIKALDTAAMGARVTVVSGASSVPALSSAVVDRYLPAFSELHAIRAGISSGARAPGLATVQGIFGYCGKPIRRLEDGTWTDTHGWLDLTRHRFPEPVGERLLGSVDVPDLELFPARYPGVRTVSFHAGFASDAGHLSLWACAGLVKAGVLPGMSRLAGPLNRISRRLEPWISDKGGMFVQMEGLGRDGEPATRRWHLLVEHNDGPFVPCGASLALANKLAAGTPLRKGAMPCMGLLTVEEYLAPLKSLAITLEADPV